MPLDASLPPSQLTVRSSAAEIVGHFPAVYGVRVDVDGLDAVPERERMGLAGARPPEPPEAVLIDRVLQLVPVAVLRGVERIVVVGRGTARYGGYLNGIVRLGAGPADRRTWDQEYGGRFSVFATTVLHEVGHAIYERALSDEQRRAVTDQYLALFIRRRPMGADEPTTRGAEHFFIDLITAVLLSVDSPSASLGEARELLRDLRLPFP